MNIEDFVISLDWRDLEDNCNVSIATIPYHEFLEYFGEYGWYDVGKFRIHVEEHTTCFVGLTCY